MCVILIVAGLRRDGRLAGLVGAYNRSLLALTAATIRLEFEIKHGFNSYSDQVKHRSDGFEKV